MYVSTESGVYQVHTWDRATGERRRVSDHPVGVIAGAFTPDGERVLYWQDDTGSEAGRWYAEAFAGGQPEPFLDGVPSGWNDGLSQAGNRIAAVITDNHVPIRTAERRVVAQITQHDVTAGSTVQRIIAEHS